MALDELLQFFISQIVPLPFTCMISTSPQSNTALENPSVNSRTASSRLALQPQGLETRNVDSRGGGTPVPLA